MPSTDETTPGDGYRVVLALYLTVAIVGAGAAVLASRGVEPERIAGVTREGEALRIERHGLRPGLSFDTEAIEDVEAVAAALTRLETPARRR